MLGAPIELEARLSVQDSPNSAGIVIDVIRYVQIARNRGLAGPLLPISAYAMKHPPVQMRDVNAARRIEEFLAAGVSKFVLRPLAEGDEGVQQQSQRLIEEVLPVVAEWNAAGVRAAE